VKKLEKSYALNPESIDNISAEIHSFLSAYKNDNAIIIKMCLIAEEILNIMLSGLGENVPVVLKLSKKTNKLWIGIEYKSKRFNPLDKDQMDSFSDQLLSGLGVRPVWSYNMDSNRITIVVPSVGDRSQWIMTTAFLFSAAAGIFGGLLQEGVRSFINTYILMPITDIFIRLLSVIAPLLIFCGIIISIVKSGISMSEKIRRYITGRYFSMSIILTAASTVFLYPFFSFRYGEGHGNPISSIGQLYDMLLDIVPGNPIQPFAEGNMLQIVILATLLGMITLGLDNRVKVVDSAIAELYTIFLHAVEFICQSLPVFIFTSMTSLLWTNGYNVFVRLWKPIVALVAVYLLLIMIYVLLVAKKYKVSVFVLIKKILPSTLIGLTTASSMAAYVRINEVNENLGISKEYSAFSVPVGNQLFCGAVSTVFLAIVYYLAELFKTPVNLDWFVIAGIISFIVSLASPPVSGGTLICLNILMTSLAIPGEGIAIASTLALLFDFVSTGSYIAMRHMEMVLQAGHMGALDADVLRSEGDQDG